MSSSSSSSTLVDLLLTVPLTNGSRVDVDGMNKFIKHAIIREKSLKIVQYSTRIIGFYARQRKLTAVDKHFTGISKQLSLARRCFKFLRWFKHFLDYRDAVMMPAPVKHLFLAEFWLNLVADLAEDLTSLQKLKIIPAHWLPDATELYANYCQLPLAFVEVAVSVLKRQMVDSSINPLKATMANLEIFKYLCDIGKGVYDCEFSFAREDVFLWSGLIAGILTTHKNVVKAVGVKKLPALTASGGSAKG
ncbi:unnamed protein product [Amoebophrya sp. A120]|nr:unnamed protein product [Amoebophrya sp. A120]|eukprot:GSA120T00005120001.1